MARPKRPLFGVNMAASAAAARARMSIKTSPREREVILAGVRAADAALARWRCFAVLELFVRNRHSPRTAPRLEALRAYAELRRVLLAQGCVVPATSLLAAGFTYGQIARFDALIVAAPAV